MTKKIVSQQEQLEVPEINMLETISQLLSRGHVVHGYSSVSNERVIKVLARKNYSDNAPMLGFGVDGQAERALGRALLTYAMRERDGLSAVTPRQYSEIEPEYISTGYHDSRFDNIIWNGDFKLYRYRTHIRAYSRYGSMYGTEPLEVSADTALEAITLLADEHYYTGTFRERAKNLPAISLG